MKAHGFCGDYFAEFCFREDDEERAVAVALSAMLTLFVSNLLPKYAWRPGFLYTANAEGSGKTLLTRLANVPRIGFTPAASLPEREEEVQKVLFSAAVAGSSVLLFDNIKRHTSSAAIRSR
jgi:DNA polymerase-1